MSAAGVQVEVLVRFAADGRVWRSFDHLVAYSGTALLLVPVGLARGNLMAVLDGLPVPWEEVMAVIEAEGRDGHALSPESLAALCVALPQCFGPEGWVGDTVPAGPKVPTLLRAVAPNGVRWARLKGRHRG